MLFYLAGLAFYKHNAPEEKNLLITGLCVFGYMFFFGLRGWVFDDWVNYYETYDKCSLDSLVNIGHTIEDTFFEPGFMILMILCKLIFPRYEFFVFVCCAINCFLLFRFLIQRVDNLPLALVFFFCMGGIVIQTNLMRNSLAVLIFLNSLTLLENRRFLPYLGCCVLAMCFHASSIIFIPLFFFLHRRMPKWLFLSIIIAGNIVFLCHIYFVTPILVKVASMVGENYEMLIERYTEGVMADKSVGLSIGYLERLLTSFLIFCYYDKLIEIREENKLFINSFVCFFVTYFLFSEFAELSERLSTLFIYCYWILWGDLMGCFSIRNNKLLYIGYLGIYCILKVMGSTMLVTQKYDNILLNPDSYEERLYIHDKYTEDKLLN